MRWAALLCVLIAGSSHAADAFYTWTDPVPASPGRLLRSEVLTPEQGVIRYLGDGLDWFRSYSDSLWKSPKVSKGLLPLHSVPRLGSACPHSGLNPWAAVTGHPWPNTANPASCRVAHGFKPAFGHRG